MSSWTPVQAEKYKQAFYAFTKHLEIKSKEHEEWINLGDSLYDGQRRTIEAIFDGLGQDIHDFKILKSRQLGISTIIRALMLFWTGVFSLTGALVFDSAQHLEEGRQELLDMLERLPANFRFPRKLKDNRYNLILENKSRVNLFSAGTREQKGTKALGAGSAISMWHRSELCNYGNISGLEHLRHSRARTNPNRLFIDESTALGFNIWYEIWQESRVDHHVVCIFVGWWSHPGQRIERNDPDFEVYGIAPLTDYEKHQIQEVYRLYGHEITAEQVAWIRRENNPVAQQEGDADADYSPSTERLQNQPWIEDDAFQMTGSVFFDPSKLLEQISRNVSDKFDTYSFMPGVEFTLFKAMKAYNAKSIELKVWEEPVEEAVYVVSADVAYGANENNDRSAIQVLRCFADGIDQVAEYAWPLVNTRQFAWVIAALEGWYAGDKSDVYRIVELNGPGEATFNELRGLKFQLANGYFGNQVDERGLRNIQKNVKNYLYHRSDSMHPSRTYHWKCLALDTRLPTPHGWTTMGDVDVGDRLIDDRGVPCTVTGVSPVQFGHECFRVTFEDGTTITADSEHFWPSRDGQLVPTFALGPMIDAIEISEPFDLPDAVLPIDPYVLGVWLGDGNSNGARYYAHADDMAEMSEHIERAGYELGEVALDSRPNVNTTRRNIIGIYKPLRESGLLGNKHIPAAYLRASYQQRLSLLQGLMDTDGHIGAARQIGFTTSNMRLSDEFSELLRSLGIKAKKCERNRTLRYNGELVVCKPAHQFWFTGYQDVPVFRLSRKKSLISEGASRKGRSKKQLITKLTRVPSVAVKCVMVDSPSHLFLAGDGMIPTHNTTSQLKVAIMERLRDFTSNGMLRIRSRDTLEEMRTISREGDSIEASGTAKDDRVISLALGIRVWDERVRRLMIAGKRTRSADDMKRRLEVRDQVKMYNENQFEAFMAGKNAQRRALIRAARHSSWRGR